MKFAELICVVLWSDLSWRGLRARVIMPSQGKTSLYYVRTRLDSPLDMQILYF